MNLKATVIIQIADFVIFLCSIYLILFKKCLYQAKVRNTVSKCTQPMENDTQMDFSSSFYCKKTNKQTHIYQ